MTDTYRLEAIALHEVGVFDDLRIDFPPKPETAVGKAEVHLFTGPNGCGKSTLLYALAEIFHPLDSESLIWRRFRNDDSRVDFIFHSKIAMYGIKLPPSKANAFGVEYGETQFENKSRGRIFCAEKAISEKPEFLVYKYDSTNFRLSNPHSQIRFRYAAFAYSGQRSVNNFSIGAIQEITNSAFENALSFDSTVRPQVLLQWIANNRTKLALAKMDGDASDALAYDKSLQRITEVIRDICGLQVEFKLSRSPLEVTLKVGEDNLQFDTLPDGLKSIISWIADLAMRLESIPWENPELDIFAQPIILFLDEIDIHLHPKWQRKVLPTVQKLFPNAQIFATTHSPFVVGSVKDAWVYRLSEKGAATSAQIEAVPSGAGKSYRLILEEIFGINEEFDDETETLFDRFYQCREAFLRAPNAQREELLKLAQDLAAKGEEARAIVGRELRQLSRLSGREIGLA